MDPPKSSTCRDLEYRGHALALWHGRTSPPFRKREIRLDPDGWRARETYKIVSQDEYIEVFEIAPPEKEFKLYSESHWKHVK
jgi:hypothetical protein